MGIGGALSVGLMGLQAFVIQLQAFVSPGLPCFSIIGLPDASLAEARERVRSACVAAGFHWPDMRVTVNMSPASLPKRGSGHDLAIAASVLTANCRHPDCLADTIVLGEVSLDGTVLPINGMLPILMHARERGLTSVIAPRLNADEAELVKGLDVMYVSHVGELIELLGAEAKTTTPNPVATLADRAATSQAEAAPAVGDMDEVIGQQTAKWALQVAAAGGHHLLMVGPPGTGKTMLASRLPGIMCPLTEQEQFEVASIRSLCGTLSRYGITDTPPFEAPHHTASVVSIAGGGTGVPEPGLVTKAHNGVLFMDEAPEFATKALQALREPLESGYVTVSRSKGTTFFPARFQLVMAANPCPCGYGYGNCERCTCRERDRIRYFGRLSGPILDRIDIQVDVMPATNVTSRRGHDGPSSARMRQAVVEARNRAAERFAGLPWSCNGQASGAWLREHTPSAVLDVVDRTLASQFMSLRGADRAMRLAWTLADLAGHGEPDAEDMHRAIALRTRV
ncbi:YifB family Mg chelatase-like AAA ATPase [Bifidobacterium choloepi]|uniref:YifB family Mg chelatase-like AAA ATPase n=1 Tax=Bifidobacterium choloepi TaxID=2614131 RepID=A0A6I5NIH6_9BIFI|nr:YifB family Mg chelatase-like AAA ATPase [Bifidobacterium choloepi]NEG70173.1 YifB family Mg chelatase-like AAA ATPase [Bifidobacterium choloepi]